MYCIPYFSGPSIASPARLASPNLYLALSKICHSGISGVLLYRGWKMAKQNLAGMPIAALLKLREQIGVVLSRKADELKSELEEIGADYADSRKTTVSRRATVSSRAGRKVPPKYRGPNGETWAGRGAQPMWMTALIKTGAKRDDFLIDKTAAKPVKKKRRAKK
jgi:DNA-binding protein H-NS